MRRRHADPAKMSAIACVPQQTTLESQYFPVAFQPRCEKLSSCRPEIIVNIASREADQRPNAIGRTADFQIAIVGKLTDERPLVFTRQSSGVSVAARGKVENLCFECGRTLSV